MGNLYHVGSGGLAPIQPTWKTNQRGQQVVTLRDYWITERSENGGEGGQVLTEASKIMAWGFLETLQLDLRQCPHMKFILIVFETSVWVVKFINVMVYCYQVMYKSFKLDQIQIPTFQLSRLYSKILHRQLLLQPMKRGHFCTYLVGIQKGNENKMYDCMLTQQFFLHF